MRPGGFLYHNEKNIEEWYFENRMRMQWDPAQKRFKLRNYSEPAITRSVKAWQSFFSKKLPPETDLKDVLSTMQPLCRDWGWIPIGGSGLRTFIFLIDDFSEVRAEIDVNDKLEQITIATRERGSKWLKFPDHMIIDRPWVTRYSSEDAIVPPEDTESSRDTILNSEMK